MGVARWTLAVVVLIGAYSLISTFTPVFEGGGEGWEIQRFDVAVTVPADGYVEVTETIAVDFGSLERHGIFRDIPYLYALPDDEDRVRETRVIIRNVTDEAGAILPYQETPLGAYWRLRIGSADVLVTGRQTYVIRYEVRGALNPFDRHDELYWNVTGDRWPVPINASSATVDLEAGSITRASCYQGPAGSTEPCALPALSGTRASFRAGRALQPGEGWTIAVAFPKGAIEVPPLEYGPTPSTPSQPLDVGVRPLYLFVSAGLIAFALLKSLVIWLRFGRDRPAETDEEAPAVVEFEPPADLRPAEMAFLLNGRTSDDDVSTTIVDLAARGYISIATIDPGDDYEIVFKNIDDRLRDYEETLLDALFKEQPDRVAVSMLRSQKFYRSVATVRKQIGKRCQKLGYFLGDPEKVRERYSTRGWALIGFAVVGVIALAISLSIVGPLSAAVGEGPLNAVLGLMVVAGALAVGGVISIIFARWMPARTPKGHAAYRRVLGFRRFMEVADRSRQEFYERKGIFERYLPYAMVFGMVDRWAQVFEELGIPVVEPSYFAGVSGDAFHVAAFGSAMSSFGSSVVSAGSPPPSTSGGSGGSGFSSSSSSSSSFGGGSSGGGSGGGGGGSW